MFLLFLSKVYELAGEIAGLDKQTVLLDVCCGTGTIGICLAGKCKEVTFWMSIYTFPIYSYIFAKAAETTT